MRKPATYDWYLRRTAMTEFICVDGVLVDITTGATAMDNALDRARSAEEPEPKRRTVLRRIGQLTALSDPNPLPEWDGKLNGFACDKEDCGCGPIPVVLNPMSKEGLFEEVQYNSVYRRSAMLNVEPKVGQVWQNPQEHETWRIMAVHKNDMIDARQSYPGVPPHAERLFTELDTSKFLADKELLCDERGQAIVHEPKLPREFKVGDCVRLKCGGPLMVVVVVPEAEGIFRNVVVVKWHDEQGLMQSAELTPAVLVHKDDDESL